MPEIFFSTPFSQAINEVKDQLWQLPRRFKDFGMAIYVLCRILWGQLLKRRVAENCATVTLTGSFSHYRRASCTL